MQHVNGTLLGAFRQAARGRLFPPIRGKMRTAAFTIPAATINHLGFEKEAPMLEKLLTAIHDYPYPEAINTPDQIHIPKRMNSMELLSGGRRPLETLAVNVRRGTITSTAASFTQRMNLQKETMNDDGPSSRLHNPLSAIQSSPGGGKSTLLDIVGQLSSSAAWTPDLCSDDDMRTILNRSIPVPITFVGILPWRPASYDTSHQRALALRILHSFFVRGKDLNLKKFADRMPPGLLPAQAIQACLAYMHMNFGDRRTNLLLLVDETRRAAGEDGKNPALFIALGEILDIFPYNQVNILSSTLDSAAIMSGSRASGRHILWSPLDKLPQGPVEDMFLRVALTNQQQHLHKLPVVPAHVIEARNARLSNKNARLSNKSMQTGYLPIEGSNDCLVLPPAARFAINDCGGHPRSLEKLQGVFFELLNDKEYIKSPDDWANKNSLKELRDRVLGQLDPTTIVQPYVEDVRAALEGKQLPLDALIGGELFAERVAGRVFLNTSLDGDDEAVPKLSMLSLLLFQYNNMELGAGHHIAMCIKEMAKQEEAAVMADKYQKPSILENKLFEMFIARWLELRLRVADKPVTIREIFHLPGPIVDSPSTALDRTVPVRRVFSVHCSQDNLSTLLQSTPKSLDISNANKVVLLGMGQMPNDRLLDNPAFNIVAVLQDDKQQGVALFLETRFSAPASATTEGQGEVNIKLALFDGAAEQTLKAPKPSPQKKSDVVDISVLDRKANTSASVDEPKHFLKENIFILDRDAVWKMLTHSLADRAQFLMDLRLDQ